MSESRMAGATSADSDEIRLLGFYDRVRTGIEAHLERRAGRLGRRAAQILLLAPDLLLLLVRLFLDREVPRATRAVIGGALAYFLLPADVVPEIVVGPGGFVDDLLVAATVLGQVLGPDLESKAELYWSGSGRAREALSEIVRTGNQMMGARLSRRVDRVIERRLLKGRQRIRGAT